MIFDKEAKTRQRRFNDNTLAIFSTNVSGITNIHRQKKINVDIDFIPFTRTNCPDSDLNGKWKTKKCEKVLNIMCHERNTS